MNGQDETEHGAELLEHRQAGDSRTDAAGAGAGDAARAASHPAERLPRSIGRRRTRRLLGGLLVVAAVLAAGGIGYSFSGAGNHADPYASGDGQRLGTAVGQRGAVTDSKMYSEAGAPVAGPAEPQKGADAANAGGAGSGDQLLQALDQRLIVRTGQIGLEVSDVDKAVIQAQAAIVGMGGEVGQTQVSGSGDNKLASITYRVPVARWDDALAALRKLGSKVLGEQTGSTDVTSQAIDLDARIANLKSTEQALQSIMAKATRIEDVLAVQNQLSNVQGQIEQLTAQSNHLKNQAAMSTLVATFQLPSSVITTATKDWSLGAQVDEAIAALVHVGQGLATVAVWLAIVILPIGIGLLILLAITWFVLRRLAPRRPETAATSAES